MSVKTPGWVWGWMVVFVLVGSIPFVVGWLAAPADTTFTGVLLNVNDTNSYYADMQLGAQGRWLYVMPYNPQPSRPVPLFMVYVLLGQAARLTSLSVPLVYHLARLSVGALFVLVSYRWIARYFTQPNEQRFALVVLLFAGGTGWFMFLLLGSTAVNNYPELTPDIWIADALSLIAMLNNVHFLFNIVLMMGAISYGESFIKYGMPRHGAMAVLAGLGIVFVHAHQLAVIGTVLVGGLVLRGWSDQRIAWPAVLRLVVSVFPAAMVALVLTLLTRNDPNLASWLEQGNTYSPPVYSLFILYGPLLPLAFVGAWHAVQMRQTVWTSMVIWLAAVLLLIYVPVNFQRRFLEGWQVPIVLLATIGWFDRVLPWLRARRVSRRARQRFEISLLVSLMITPLFVLSGLLARVLWMQDTNAFLDRDVHGSHEWLDRHAGLDDVVLSSYDNGNRLAALVDVRSFLGHWSLTAFVEQRETDVERFFADSTPDADRIALLKEFDISYVYFAKEERALGDFVPQNANYLTPVYTSPTVTVFRVQLAEP